MPNKLGIEKVPLEFVHFNVRKAVKKISDNFEIGNPCHHYPKNRALKLFLHKINKFCKNHRNLTKFFV